MQNTNLEAARCESPLQMEGLSATAEPQTEVKSASLASKTNDEASSVEFSPNTSCAPAGPQNAGGPMPVGKNHEKNKRKKERRKLQRSMSSMTLSPEAEALLSKKRPRQLSGASNLTTPRSHQPTKRFRSGVEAVAEQGADTGG